MYNHTICEVEFEDLTPKEQRRLFPEKMNTEFNRARFEPIPQLTGLSRRKRVMEFEFAHLGIDVDTDSALGLIGNSDYRAAVYEEAVCLMHRNPVFQRLRPIACLGSFAKISGNLYMPYFWRDLNGNVTCLARLDCLWHADFVYLVAKEVSSKMTEPAITRQLGMSF
ncbi:MAG: hypothetical protein ABH861_00950 [Patescibacteria group bacterium]|nr:hypothetical protein [Patescibacteria group bacterium]